MQRSATKTNVLVLDNLLTSGRGLKALIQEYEEYNVSLYNHQINPNHIEDIPEILVLSLTRNLSGTSELLSALLTKFCNLKVIILINESEYQDYLNLQLNGINGVILDTLCSQELYSCLTVIRHGGEYFSSTLSRDELKVTKRTNKKHSGVFNAQEINIIKLIAEGCTNRSIAGQLFLSERTIEWHRRKILKKANVKNTIELVLYSIDNNIIESPLLSRNINMNEDNVSLLKVV